MADEQKDLIEHLKHLLADTYALYLKTQNYHWHVKGPHFKILHELFEQQYMELAQAVDTIAERILMKGYNAPATFKEYEELKSIQDGHSNAASNDMVRTLAFDHAKLIQDLNKTLAVAQAMNDEGSIQLLSERIAIHEKTRWMLQSSLES